MKRLTARIIQHHTRTRHNELPRRWRCSECSPLLTTATPPCHCELKLRAEGKASNEAISGVVLKLIRLRDSRIKGLTPYLDIPEKKGWCNSIDREMGFSPFGLASISCLYGSDHNILVQITPKESARRYN
ncbi:MAG: hypothetical protein E3J66_01410 [Dehalococcoidia bacterium]|nr:MAG: hypothetical protein E3J66_01410 [Dehalococcoidia bacterium]